LTGKGRLTAMTSSSSMPNVI